MKKIGIFGGTFNPIHNGHLNMAENIGINLNLDFILVIPASIPPHKAWLNITDDKHRYEMCRLACEGNPLFKVSDIELKREGRSYTIDTLNEISSNYKDSRLYLIMGSDSFMSVNRWVGFKEIINLTTLCTTSRDISENEHLYKMNKMLQDMGANTKICDTPILPISSTVIRKNIYNGLEINSMVSEKVADYIRRNKLFI